jgi:hypothetical protein
MNTQVPDIYAALIVRENGRWVFKYDQCVCSLMYTQTNPCVVRLFDSGGDRYYLVVFSDNSGGFGGERIYSVLLKVSGNGISVLGEHPVTDYGDDPVPYYWCPVAATVREEPGKALVAIAFYRGDTGYGQYGHRAGDVVLQLVEVSVATQQGQQQGGQQGGQQQGGQQQGGQQGQGQQGQQGGGQQGGQQGQQSQQGQQGGQQQQQSQQTGQQGGQQGGFHRGLPIPVPLTLPRPRRRR